ncbi:phosphoenolpyruvate synthase [Halobacteriales archaeon QS_4_69_31]|nr:MAG: phosphoenolpyruvate synthase [Halobacteriales archaeon QS_4_69_31]
MEILWLDEVAGSDLETVGGKAASLGELAGAGLPVPPAFIVTAETYRSFLEETGIAEELFETVDVSPEDTEAVARAAEHAQELIEETPMPATTREAILGAYDEMGDDPSVAVRSSATAEDLPDASFAGQQETFLNVDRSRLLDCVQDCWASLFTQRALTYRDKQGFSHADVDIAVVVQRMVDAEKSGVMFTRHPSTGADEVVVESAWGLGEAVVSGAVSPDKYVLDRETGAVRDVNVATKRVMHVRDSETGETVERPVPEERRDERVLSDAELRQLADLATTVEDHYGDPQDVEWAMADDSDHQGLYLLQSRPITTIDAGGEAAETGAGGQVGSADGGQVESAEGAATGEAGEVALTGIGASPGKATGPVRIVETLDHLDRVAEGDVIVAEMTTPDMVSAMQRAAGILTDEGGMTSHASIVSRELCVPAVVGTGDATDLLSDGELVTIDGDKGTVTRGGDTTAGSDADEAEAETAAEAAEPAGGAGPSKPMTATEVKVNISIPDAAETAAATGADGVGLLRVEHMVVSTGKTPEKYIEDHGEEAYVDEIVDGIRTVAEAFYPRPVRVRTLDAPTDEFRELAGGEREPTEHNPMLGWRGIRRSLDTPDVFATELAAFRELFDMGYDNVEVMFPLVNDAEDVRRARARLTEAGIDPGTRNWGVMIETPAAALSIDGIADTNPDFVSFGTNDLTQYTLAVDRNNERVAGRFDELHPAVLELMTETIETCNDRGVATSICGQAASKPQMVEHLVEAGITSLSANIDAVRDVQHKAKRVEQRLMLDTVRRPDR